MGSEKQQSLKYKSHTNLSYKVSDVPKLLPAHQFSFFKTDEVTDRMRCKIMGDEEECRKIEQRRCLSKGNTTEAYEVCMITMLNKEEVNSTRFCVDHYNFKNIWVDQLSPKYLMYYKRMHNCLRFSGIPLGRDYCQDMFIYSDGWSKKNLFNCYRKHQVEFGKEYCEYLFAAGGSKDKNDQALLQCFGTKGLEKGEEYCEITFPGDD